MFSWLLLDELLSNITSKEDFEKVKEALLKQGIKSLLNLEMLAQLVHLKGEKPIDGDVLNGFSEKTIKPKDGNHRTSGVYFITLADPDGRIIQRCKIVKE